MSRMAGDALGTNVELIYSCQLPLATYAPRICGRFIRKNRRPAVRSPLRAHARAGPPHPSAASLCAADRRGREAGRSRHHGDAAVPQGARFGGRPPPPRSLGEHRPQRRVLRAEGRDKHAVTGPRPPPKVRVTSNRYFLTSPKRAHFALHRQALQPSSRVREPLSSRTAV